MINYTQHSDSRGEKNNTDINIKASNILPFLLTLKSGFNKKTNYQAILFVLGDFKSVHIISDLRTVPVSTPCFVDKIGDFPKKPHFANMLQKTTRLDMDLL